MIRPLLQLLILTATLITTSAEELPYFNFVGVPHPVIVNSSDPTYLDCSTITYGVDWFGRNNTNMRWSPPTASPSLSIPPVSSQAQPPSNPFFDPAKPSVLHFPGWEKGRCLVNQKTTFNFRRNQWDGSIHMPVNENAADYWVDDYNIGIFQWNSFNEDSIFKSEDNIYRGPLMWCNEKGQYTQTTFNDSVLDLAYQTYMSIFNTTDQPYTQDIRLTGNSLGAQIVIQLTKMLIDRLGPDHPLIPKRIGLLDPWFTRGKIYADNLAAAKEVAQSNVLIEYYLSSPLCFFLFPMCRAKEIKILAALSESRPLWVGSLTRDPTLAWSLKHVASFNDYYRSRALKPPLIACLKSQKIPCTAEDALSASSNNEIVRREMGRTKYLLQINGTHTSTLADDVYARLGYLDFDDQPTNPWRFRIKLSNLRKKLRKLTNFQTSNKCALQRIVTNTKITSTHRYLDSDTSPPHSSSSSPSFDDNENGKRGYRSLAGTKLHAQHEDQPAVTGYGVASVVDDDGIVGEAFIYDDDLCDPRSDTNQLI